MRTKEQSIFIIAVLFFLSGCSTPWQLSKKAEQARVAGDFYESINKPSSAEEQYKKAEKLQNDAKEWPKEWLYFFIDFFGWLDDDYE